MKVLGIDPGATGALAIVEGLRGERARLLEVIDVPMIGEKSLRRPDASRVLAFLQKYKPDRGMIERAQAMPVKGRNVAKDSPESGQEWQGQGASSAFNYGKTCGALIMAVDGMGIDWASCESTQWKKTTGIPLGVAQKIAKEHSRHRAAVMFGGSPFSRVMDHNRAEAALIAWHGLQFFLSGN